MLVQRDRNAVAGADLLDGIERPEQRSPRILVPLEHLPVVFRSLGGGQDHHVSPRGGEELCAPLDEGELFVSYVRIVQHGGHETANQAQTIPAKHLGHLGGVARQKFLGAGFYRLQAERCRLVQHPVGGHLVAPVRDLNYPPGDRGTSDARVHQTTSEPSFAYIAGAFSVGTFCGAPERREAMQASATTREAYPSQASGPAGLLFSSPSIQLRSSITYASWNLWSQSSSTR